MKTIAKILLVGLMLTASALTSCTDYQDEIDALDNRVTILEDLVGKANSNIDAMQTLVNAMADGWVITGIVEVDPAQDPNGRGYRTITFGKIDPNTGELSTKPDDQKVITLYNGKDADEPEITLKKDPVDGNYYWVVDGNYIPDQDGNRVQANGKNGKDGVNGQDGKDGEDGKSTAPKIGINKDGYWVYTYGDDDNVDNWPYLLDSNKNPIKATGKDGKDGNPGKDAREFITNVDIRLGIDGTRYIVITFDDGTEQGTQVRLPLVS